MTRPRLRFSWKIRVNCLILRDIPLLSLAYLAILPKTQIGVRVSGTEALQYQKALFRKSRDSCFVTPKPRQSVRPLLPGGLRQGRVSGKALQAVTCDS